MLELLFSLAILTTLLGLSLFTFSPLVTQSRLNTAVSMLQGALEEAQLRALQDLRSYRVQLQEQQVWLQSRRSSGWENEQLWEVLPAEVAVRATRWPSFSAHGFAVGGTLTLQLEQLTQEIRVSPVGRIYQP